MARPILVMVEDLFFLARIRETAARAGVEIRTASPGEAPGRIAPGGASAAIFDLNHPRALEAIRALKADPATAPLPLVGFVSHVQADLVEAARAAGCDRVLARSAFTQQLAQLLTELAAPAVSSSRRSGGTS